MTAILTKSPIFEFRPHSICAWVVAIQCAQERASKDMLEVVIDSPGGHTE